MNLLIRPLYFILQSAAYNQFIKGNFHYGVKEDTKARSHKNSNVMIDASDSDTEELKNE
jgi:hypothetical protein